MGMTRRGPVSGIYDDAALVGLLGQDVDDPPLMMMHGVQQRRRERAQAWARGPIITAAAWAATTAVTLGTVRRLPSGRLIECTGAGTTGAAAPAFVGGRPISDGTATWYATGWLKTTDDAGAPTITQHASAAAAGLTEVSFSSGNALQNCQVLGGVGVGLFSGAYVGAYSLVTGSNGGNAQQAATDLGLPTSGVGYQATCWELEWVQADTVVGITFHNANVRALVEIDGQLLQAEAYMHNGVSGGCMKVDFGVWAERRVRVISIDNGATIRGAAVTAQGSVRAGPASEGGLLWLGDSFGRTVVPSGGSHHRGIAQTVQKRLGFDELWDMSIGGSGYTGANAGDFSVVQVLDNATNRANIIKADPGHVVIGAGFNDRGKAAAVVRQDAQRTWRRVREMMPGVRLTVLAGWSGASGPDANAISTAQALADEFVKWGDGNSLFLNNINAGGSAAWVWGSGHVGQALASGNSSYITSTDGTHPSANGGRIIGERVADEMAMAWAPYGGV